MAEETQSTPQATRAESHPASPNPEMHLLDAHKLSIQLQGKEGPGGLAVWALVREERGKVKTLAVQKGTRREAVARFYDYIHPNKPAAPVAPARRTAGPRPSGPRPTGPRPTGPRPTGPRPAAPGPGSRPPQRPAR